MICFKNKIKKDGMMWAPNKSMRGFSLVEMIVYIAFVSIFSGLVVEGLLTSMRIFADFQLTREVNSTATTAMERMVREIRTANDVDIANSVLGTNPGRLTLKTLDSNGLATTTEFFVDAASERIKIKEGGVDAGFLSSQKVATDILIFDVITNARTKAVTIRLQLSAVHLPQEKIKTFYSTATLRGSY
jgi:type II secretory pathway pseudopilin PulG